MCPLDLVYRLLVSKRTAADDLGADVIQRIRIVLNGIVTLVSSRARMGKVWKSNVPLCFRSAAGDAHRHEGDHS